MLAQALEHHDGHEPPEVAEGVPVLIDRDQHRDGDAEALEGPEPRAQRVIEEQVGEAKQQQHRDHQQRIGEAIGQRQEIGVLGDRPQEMERREHRRRCGDQPEVEVRTEVAPEREHEEVQQRLPGERSDEEHLVPRHAPPEVTRVRHHRRRFTENETEARSRLPPVEAHEGALVVAHRERVAPGAGKGEAAVARTESMRPARRRVVRRGHLAELVEKLAVEEDLCRAAQVEVETDPLAG